MADSPKKVRYQTDQEQNNKNEEENSGNLRSGESYNSEAKNAGYQGNQEEHQRIVKHGNSFR
jgi:hypothetical protein